MKILMAKLDKCPGLKFYQDLNDRQRNGMIDVGELLCLTCRFRRMVRKSKGKVRVDCLFDEYQPRLENSTEDRARLKPYFSELKLLMDGESSIESVKEVEEELFGGPEDERMGGHLQD